MISMISLGPPSKKSVHLDGRPFATSRDAGHSVRTAWPAPWSALLFGVPLELTDKFVVLVVNKSGASCCLRPTQGHSHHVPIVSRYGVINLQAHSPRRVVLRPGTRYRTLRAGFGDRRLPCSYPNVLLCVKQKPPGWASPAGGSLEQDPLLPRSLPGPRPFQIPCQGRERLGLMAAVALALNI